MKLLHVINSLHYGGAEKLLTDSLSIYKNKGIDVELLLLNNTKSSFFKRLESSGIKIFFPLQSRSIYNPLIIIYILKILRRGQYDIVHVHLFPALYWVALAKIFLIRAPQLVFTEHNTENKRRKNRILSITDKLVYRAYSLIIAISKGTEQNLKGHLKNPTLNIITINNGINLDEITEATPYDPSEFGLNQDAVILIQVSSFTPQKDQNTVIKALSGLPHNFFLILVGDGPLRVESETLAKQLGVKDRVLFLGYRHDVPRIIKSSSIVILSSHYEGFGLAIVEGMAAEKPCIGSNVPGLSEVLEKKDLLIEPGDYKALGDKILELTNNNELFIRVSEYCCIRSKLFSIEKMASRYVQEYAKLINQ